MIAEIIGQNLQGSIDRKLDSINRNLCRFFFFFLGRISNSAQARLTCRVLCFTPIIKGKNPNYVSMAFESYVLNLL